MGAGVECRAYMVQVAQRELCFGVSKPSMQGNALSPANR